MSRRRPLEPEAGTIDDRDGRAKEPPKSAARRQRLAEQLRRNLRRRKAAAGGEPAGQTQGEDRPPTEPNAGVAKDPADPAGEDGSP